MSNPTAPKTPQRGPFLFGYTRGKSIRFVQEGRPFVPDGKPGLGPVDLPIEPRDWDVMDEDELDAAAQRELGDDYDYYCEHPFDLQWWVNPGANSAGLAIYRPRPDGPA